MAGALAQIVDGATARATARSVRQQRRVTIGAAVRCGLRNLVGGRWALAAGEAMERGVVGGFWPSLAHSVATASVVAELRFKSSRRHRQSQGPQPGPLTLRDLRRLPVHASLAALPLAGLRELRRLVPLAIPSASSALSESLAIDATSERSHVDRVRLAWHGPQAAVPSPTWSRGEVITSGAEEGFYYLGQHWREAQVSPVVHYTHAHVYRAHAYRAHALSLSVDATDLRAWMRARSAAMSAGKAGKAGEDGAAGGAEAGRSDKPACNLFVAHVRPRGGRDDVGWSSTGSGSGGSKKTDEGRPRRRTQYKMH